MMPQKLNGNLYKYAGFVGLMYGVIVVIAFIAVSIVSFVDGSRPITEETVAVYIGDGPMDEERLRDHFNGEHNVLRREDLIEVMENLVRDNIVEYVGLAGFGAYYPVEAN